MRRIMERLTTKTVILRHFLIDLMVFMAFLDYATTNSQSLEVAIITSSWETWCWIKSAGNTSFSLKAC